MKALIIYFSGTGNTQMITDEIVSGMREKGWDTEAVSIEELDTGSRDFNFNLRTMDMLGFGFPVYKFSYPEIMNRLFPFLSNLKPSGKPFFVYSTYCRFAATAVHRLTAEIERTETAEQARPHIPVALRAFKCPSNGIASLKESDSKAYRDVMYFSPGINSIIDSFISDILTGFARYCKQGRGTEHHGGPIDQFRENLVGRIEISRYPCLSIDTALCTVCGLCAKRCPDNNLQLSADEGRGGRIIIKDTRGCLHCLRCLHICPQKAVTFGPLVNGPSHYRPAVRKALFREAGMKNPGDPEPGTLPVRLRWALGNLRHFLFSRKPV